MLVSLGLAAIAAIAVGLSTAIVVNLQKAEALASEEALERYKKQADINISEAQSRAASARSDAARANERTVAIESENLKLRTQIAPRRLSPEQADELVSLLTKYPGKRIQVSSYALDGEGAALGLQILRVMAVSGVIPNMFLMSESPIGSVTFGLAVGGPDAALVAELTDAFTKFGLGPVSPRQSGPPVGISMSTGMEGSFSARILVGVKPLAE